MEAGGDGGRDLVDQSAELRCLAFAALRLVVARALRKGRGAAHVRLKKAGAELCGEEQLRVLLARRGEQRAHRSNARLEGACRGGAADGVHQREPHRDALEVAKDVCLL